jgi:hypothetical protein
MWLMSFTIICRSRAHPRLHLVECWALHAVCTEVITCIKLLIAHLLEHIASKFDYPDNVQRPQARALCSEANPSLTACKV